MTSERLSPRSVMTSAFIALCLLSLIYFTYHNLYKTFFQQDEWVGLGQIIASNYKVPINERYSLLDHITGKGRILGVPLNYILFTIKPFDTSAFATFSIVFHTTNSFLVFIVIRKFFKNTFIGFVGSLLFACASVAREGIIWFAAVTTTLPSATFLLLSLLFLLEYKDTKLTRHALLCQIFSIISFLFKESSIFFVVGLPFFYGLLQKKRIMIAKLVKDFRVFWISSLYALIVIVARIANIFSAQEIGPVHITQHSDIWIRLVFHAAIYPLLAFSQLFIPESVVTTLSNFLLINHYEFLHSNPMANSISKIVISELVSLFFSITLLTFFAVIHRVSILKRKAFNFAIVFTITSFLPFVILDHPFSSFLESRYYYVGTIGAALLVGLIVESLQGGFKKRWGLTSLVVISLFFFVSGLYLFKQIVIIQRDLNYRVEASEERKRLLASFKQLRPALPNKPVIYLSGDSPGFYGLSDLTIPFQQGMGYTLMVWYGESEKVPKALIQEGFLWDLYEEGYKESGSRGFGYFWNKKKLREVVVHGYIQPDQILGFYYIASEKRLVDISRNLRQEIFNSL